MGKPCAQCGQPTTEGARVCTQCGAPLAAQAAAQPPFAAQTMLGFSSPFAAPKQPPALQPPQQQPPQQVQPAAPQPPVQAQPLGMAQTMLGFAAPAELRAMQQAQPQPQPLAPAAPGKPAIAKTMLGVAMPGIAPMHASAPNPAAKIAASGTMLGVAMPGIAPAHSQPGVGLQPVQPPRTPYEPPPPIIPAPTPLAPEAAPSAPLISPRKGFPLAIVAVIVGVLVLVGGVALLVLSRSAPPMAATAKVSAEGKDQLHLRCETCADGTTAALSGVKATFKNKEADIDLQTPLVIGDNRFQIAIDRPGVGRDETVKLVLPLAYRIRGDVDEIAAAKPVIKVQVEAQPGASVKIDGKPAPLDASGKATLSYDVAQDTSGLTDETRTIERKIPYEVEEKDHKKSTGEVAIRVAVLPLHLDAPGAMLVTDETAVWVSGRTSKGAVVTANGTALAVAPDGSFEGRVDIALGAHAIAIRAAPLQDVAVKVAPRTTMANVKRVAAVDAEASALDKHPDFGFDPLAADPNAALGPVTTVTGAVLDTRTTHHHTVMLIDNKKGCEKAPCLARVDYGAETAIRAGDVVTAYGVAGKPVASSDGKTLPEIDAALVRKAHR